MKGIILAAGKGSRLYPSTLATPKPLLPVYDKPLIYYSIDILMKAGIKDILIIIPPGEEKTFEKLLGDGSGIGVSIQYKVQDIPRGIADAFIVGETFIGNSDVCLILGDNIFYHKQFESLLEMSKKQNMGASVFGYWVEDPRPFGVVEFDADGNAVSIEEKPTNPKSNYIIPGLYFYDNRVVEIAKKLRPSARGELEITDINKAYMETAELKVIPLDKGFMWLDAGTETSLLEASNLICDFQKKDEYIACIEETAYKMGYITEEELLSRGKFLGSTEYGKHIINLISK